MPEWDPDLTVDQAMVDALLAEQFPAVDRASARLLGEGWDNSVWVVEERWAFRFPHREVAVPGVERELAVLPRLAPLLPAPIPVPTFVGRPSDRFPWPFFGAPLLAGSEPAEAELRDGDLVALGRELGRFLQALHGPSTRSVVDPSGSLPVDPIRRADMPFRVERMREKLEQIDWNRSRDVESILSQAERLPPSRGELVVTHGDLHVRHVLVQEAGLSGVIDWGDVCLSDPAIDLMLLWSLLTPAGREAFVAEYGRVDEEQRLRARVLALFLGVTLVLYARDVGNAALESACLVGLERTLVDWD